jgi:hypothetical protein
MFPFRKKPEQPQVQQMAYPAPVSFRDGHFNTVKWISEADYIPTNLREKYPATLEKDAPLSILRPHEIRRLVWGIEVAELVSYMLKPYAVLMTVAPYYYVHKEKLCDLSLVRLSKAEHGKLVELAMKQIAVIERHDTVKKPETTWW